MNKHDLITTAMGSTREQMTYADAERFFNTVFNTIKSDVANGNMVFISGFGTFSVKDRAERTARNPQTGEPITIPAKKAPAFKASSAFKDVVNE